MDAHLLFYGDNMISSAAGLFAGQSPVGARAPVS